MRSIRVITLNLWNDSGLADRRMESLVPALLALSPSVIGLQEVRARPDGRSQSELIAKALRGEFRFAAVDEKSPGGPIGNAIISRFPILATDSLTLPALRPDDHRGALRCDLETPAGRLAVISTHLSWELDAAPVREQQAVVLDEWARQRAGELPTVMMGDFNCTPDSLVHQFLTGRASLLGRGTYWRDAFQRRHPHSDGFTWSARNPHVARSVERNRRIDYVFVGPMADRGPGAILHARVVLDLPDSSETYASDHFGVFVEIALDTVEAGL